MLLDTWPQIKQPDRHAGEYEQFDGPKIFWSAVKDFDANFLASVKKWKSEKMLSATLWLPDKDVTHLTEELANPKWLGSVNHLRKFQKNKGEKVRTGM